MKMPSFNISMGGDLKFENNITDAEIMGAVTFSNKQSNTGINGVTDASKYNGELNGVETVDLSAEVSDADILGSNAGDGATYSNAQSGETDGTATTQPYSTSGANNLEGSSNGTEVSDVENIDDVLGNYNKEKNAYPNSDGTTPVNEMPSQKTPTSAGTSTDVNSSTPLGNKSQSDLEGEGKTNTLATKPEKRPVTKDPYVREGMVVVTVTSKEGERVSFNFLEEDYNFLKSIGFTDQDFARVIFEGVKIEDIVEEKLSLPENQEARRMMIENQYFSKIMYLELTLGELGSKINEIKVEIANLEGQKETLEEEINDLEVELDNINQRLSGYSRGGVHNDTVSALSKRKAEIEKLISEKEAELYTIKNELYELNKELVPYERAFDFRYEYPDIKTFSDFENCKKNIEEQIEKEISYYNRYEANYWLVETISDLLSRGFSIDSILKVVLYQYKDADGNYIFTSLNSEYHEDDYEYVGNVTIEEYLEENEFFNNDLFFDNKEKEGFLGNIKYYLGDDGMISADNPQEYYDCMQYINHILGFIDSHYSTIPIDEERARLEYVNSICDSINKEVNYYMDNIDLVVIKEDFEQYNKYIPFELDVSKFLVSNSAIKYDINDIIDVVYVIVNGKIEDYPSLLFAVSRGNLNNNDKYDLARKYLTYEKFMSKEELAVFNYLYNKEGYDAAYQFLINSIDRYEGKLSEEKIKKDYEFAREHPVLASLYSVFITPFDGLGAALFSLESWLTGNKLYQSDVYSRGDVYRAAVAELIAFEYGEGWANVYSIGMSILDTSLYIGVSVLTGGSSTVCSLALMGTRIFPSVVNSALSRGLSDGKAILLGIIAVFAETVAEKLSLDKLLSFDLGTGFVGVITDMVKQGFFEGMEEALTEIINFVSDEIISGELSNFSLSVKSYMDAGYSEYQASRLSLRDHGDQIQEAFVGGVVSGFFFESAGRMTTFIKRNISKGIAKKIVADLTDLDCSMSQIFDRLAQDIVVSQEIGNSTSDVSPALDPNVEQPFASPNPSDGQVVNPAINPNINNKTIPDTLFVEPINGAGKKMAVSVAELRQILRDNSGFTEGVNNYYHKLAAFKVLYNYFLNAYDTGLSSLEIVRLNNMVNKLDQAIAEANIERNRINKQLANLSYNVIKVGNIKLYVPQNTSFQTYGVVDEVIRIIKKMPPQLRNGITKITFSPFRAASSDFWKIAFDDVNHEGVASASYQTGEIILNPLFNNCSLERMTDILNHEAAHLLDKRTISYSAEWSNAINLDGNYPTRYAMSNNAEDFADSVSEYIKDPDNFKIKFPNRAKIIEGFLNKNVSFFGSILEKIQDSGFRTDAPVANPPNIESDFAYDGVSSDGVVNLNLETINDTLSKLSDAKKIEYILALPDSTRVALLKATEKYSWFDHYTTVHLNWEIKDGEISFNIDWPHYGGFKTETIKSFIDVFGNEDFILLDRFGGTGGGTYALLVDGKIFNINERAIFSDVNLVKYRQIKLDVKKYKTFCDYAHELVSYVNNNNIADSDIEMNEFVNSKINELGLALGLDMDSEQCYYLIYKAIFGEWSSYRADIQKMADGSGFKRPDIVEPSEISGIDSKYGYYGEAAPWIKNGKQIADGGALQLNLRAGEGILTALGIIDSTEVDFNLAYKQYVENLRIEGLIDYATAFKPILLNCTSINELKIRFIEVGKKLGFSETILNRFIEKSIYDSDWSGRRDALKQAILEGRYSEIPKETFEKLPSDKQEKLLNIYEKKYLLNSNKNGFVNALDVLKELVVRQHNGFYVEGVTAEDVLTYKLDAKDGKFVEAKKIIIDGIDYSPYFPSCDIFISDQRLLEFTKSIISNVPAETLSNITTLEQMGKFLATNFGKIRVKATTFQNASFGANNFVRFGNIGDGISQVGLVAQHNIMGGAFGLSDLNGVASNFSKYCELMPDGKMNVKDMVNFGEIALSGVPLNNVYGAYQIDVELLVCSTNVSMPSVNNRAAYTNYFVPGGLLASGGAELVYAPIRPTEFLKEAADGSFEKFEPKSGIHIYLGDNEFVLQDPERGPVRVRISTLK